jgi:L-asparaginase/Glu-tRNA(Gln) amidotransferase subunit D
VDLNTSSGSAVTLEDDLSTIVPHEQVQVGAVADGLVVGCAGRGSLSCDTADSLRGPDEAGVVAVCTVAGVGGVQVGDPGLGLEF